MRNSRLVLTLAVTGLCLHISTQSADAYESTVGAATNVYSGPGARNTVIDTLTAGEKINVGKCRIFWCFVQHGGPDGWIRSSAIVKKNGGSANSERDGGDDNGGGGGGGGAGNAGNAGGIGNSASGGMIAAWLRSIFGS